MQRVFLCCLLMVVSTSCRTEFVEKQFFSGDIPTRMERLEAYPLDQQWRIFLYGNQVIHPSIKSMALPIAKKGKLALDYILQELKHSRNEPDYRDSLVVFERMQQGGYYDICSDGAAMTEIIANKDKITHLGWRGLYEEVLDDLCKK